MRVAARVLGRHADLLEQLADPVAPAALRQKVAWIDQGSAMICATVIRGLSEAYGSWNTILRRSCNSSPGGQCEQVLAKDLIRSVLVLMGHHQALVYAVHGCHDRFNALDWRLWGGACF